MKHPPRNWRFSIRNGEADRGVRRLRKDGVSVRGFMGSEGETLESQPNPAGFQG
jgi:hypothetical protein